MKKGALITLRLYVLFKSILHKSWNKPLSYLLFFFSMPAFLSGQLVTQPSTGTIWSLGQTNVPIQWTTEGLSCNVKIELNLNSSTVATINSSTPNDGSYSWNVPTNLTVSSNYRVKVTFLLTGYGAGYSEYFSIQPAAATKPTVTTGSASNIAATSANIRGTVNPNGALTTWYFKFGETTTYERETYPENSTGTSTTTVEGFASGLKPSTLYHYMLVATNTAGTSYGSDKTFTTPPANPGVTTDAATNITSTSAQLNATVNPHGYSTDTYFQYGPTSSYSSTTQTQNVGSGTSSVPTYFVVNNLEPGKIYHYRIIATSYGGTSPGNDVTFQTTAQSVFYTISGTLKYPNNKPVKELVVRATNASNSTLTYDSQKSDNSTGTYTISNLPAGSYNLTILNSTDYTVTSSFTNPVVISNANITGRNFTLEGRAQPSVRLDAPTNFTPGQPFTVTAYFKNTNHATSTLTGYLDVSFPDNPTVTVISSSPEWGSPTIYPANYYPIYNSSGDLITSTHVLMSAEWKGTIYNQVEKYVTMSITPPSGVTSIRIRYRGTIADKIDPSTGSVTDQQGWQVYEISIPIINEALITDWTTVNVDGIDYIVKLKTNTGFNLSNRIISQEYCDFVDAVSIYSIQNGQEVLVEDQSKLLSILTLAANKVLLNNVTDPVRYNSISNSDIQYIKDVIDNNGNKYRLSSLIDLSNDEKLIRNPTVNFINEGTDFYNERYRMYSENIKSMVYHLDEDQIGLFIKDYASVLSEIDFWVDKMDLARGITDETLKGVQISMINALKPTSSSFTVMNTLNQSLSISRLTNFLSKWGFVMKVLKSIEILTKDQIKVYFKYLLLTEATGLKIETLYKAIEATTSAYKDIALVNAIKDVKYDFYARYNIPETGDWTRVLYAIRDGGESFINKSALEIGFIWAGYTVARFGVVYGYLAWLPIAAEKALINSRNKVRNSILSTNIHEILYLSIKNRKFEVDAEDVNINFYGTANNLMYMSAYIAHNYMSDYHNDLLTKIFMPGNNQEASFYYKMKANTALEYYIISGSPWYFSGTPELAFNQTCLAGKLTTTYLETEQISPPILSSTKITLLRNESVDFFASGAVSNHNSQLTYQFDFGDGILSSWNSGAASHAYANTGNFIVKVKARSQKNTLIESPWSNSIEIKVTNPETITKPGTPVLPVEVKVNQQFIVNTSGSTSSAGSQLEYQYNWGNGFYSSWGSTSSNYVFEYPGTYNIYVRARSKTNSSIISNWSDPAQIAVRNLPKISGILIYGNSISTPLNNVTINLINSSNIVVDNSLSDATGKFSFSGLSDGIYFLKPNITKPWAVPTAMDITAYKKHIGNLSLLTPLQARSGDVNGSNSLTTIDLTIIKQRINSQISSFPVGDWLYDSPSITISRSDITQNITALCYGDANGSYVPSGKSESSPEIFFACDENVKFINDREFEVPVKMSNAVSKLSSVTLKFKYPSEILEVTGIKMTANNEDLDYFIKDGLISLIFSTLNPLDLKEGDKLMTICFRINPETSNEHLKDFQLNLSGAGEFGDFDDKILDGVKLLYPSKNIMTEINTEENDDIILYPNPATNSVTITNVENSTIAIYDLMGNCILTEKSTSKQKVLSISRFSSGTYIVKIRKYNTSIFKKLSVQ
jgi:hypothetical protein